MIRDRLEQDLTPLCSVLEELNWPPDASTAGERRAWLRELDGERSWVFDAAPVTVTPTGNVQGHVQIWAPDEGEAPLVEASGRSANTLLVIGRLFVRPGPHADGVRRFLLTQAVRHVDTTGRSAVLDLVANPALSETLCRRRGFESLPAVGGVHPMVHPDPGGTGSTDTDGTDVDG